MPVIFARLLGCMLLAFAGLASADDAVPDPATVAAIDAWAAGVENLPVEKRRESYVPLLELPDADLVFLAIAKRQTGEARYQSRQALGRLHTDRTFTLLAADLTHANMFVRERALETLREYRDPRCIDLFIAILADDPEPQLRKAAATGIGQFTDARAIAALTRAMDDEVNAVAIVAASQLCRLQVVDAIAPTYRLFKQADGRWSRETGVQALASIHHKQVIPILLELMQSLSVDDAVFGEYLAGIIDRQMVAYATATAATLGPEPDTAEQWRIWWTHAEPLFDDQMTLLQPPQPPTVFTDDQYATDVSKLTLTASLDKAVYRRGEAIRLDLVFANPTDAPYRVIQPDPPSPWWSTMAWGIVLRRTSGDGATLIDTAPSDHYQGSYSGPPSFQDLAPRASFRDTLCLQRWLGMSWMRSRLNRDLPEGDYELILTFDSSKFAAINPQGVERTGRWQAKPIRFTVKGAPLDDPDEILAVVAEKAGLRWLRTDLTSRRQARKSIAWAAIREYGDSRLVPLLSELPGDSKAKNDTNEMIDRSGIRGIVVPTAADD